ncbi:Hypothetical predicted protein [Paramuricea clavata]|uniref:Uncharacterized protein n=1 Tax=Paramuricea clavata TaxID=317549 RepID=A0A7D9ITG9_PARCT|nr:Hypothetical predicted protein [Paramuricea clavata]
MSKCCLCTCDLDNGQPIVELHKKGADSMNDVGDEGINFEIGQKVTLIAAEISAEKLVERKTLDRQLQQKSNQPLQDARRILNFYGMSIASSVVNQQNTMGARKALKLSQ